MIDYCCRCAAHPESRGFFRDRRSQRVLIHRVREFITPNDYIHTPAVRAYCGYRVDADKATLLGEF